MVDIVWEFEVKPEHIAAFELHYGPAGTWAQLFRTSMEYGGTVLLRDSERPGRYLTIDRWPNLATFEHFKQKHEAEYRRIDAEMEHLTSSEKRLGVFQPIGQ